MQDDHTSPTDYTSVDQCYRFYNMFNLGREIYINLKGLYIGEYRTGDRVVSIDSLDVGNDRLTQISGIDKKTSFVQKTQFDST